MKDELNEIIEVTLDYHKRKFKQSLTEEMDILTYISSDQVKWLMKGIPKKEKERFKKIIEEYIYKQLIDSELSIKTLWDKELLLKVKTLKTNQDIIWNVLDNNVKISYYDTIKEELIPRKIKLEDELSELLIEKKDTEIVLTNTNSLLKNNLWNLYMLSILFPRKYQVIKQTTIDELNQDITLKRNEIDKINDTIKCIINDYDIDKTLMILKRIFKRFPNIISYESYINYNKKESD